jgi:ABC-type polysaccharide/polyol phosphate transport system ATPase subunit
MATSHVEFTGVWKKFRYGETNDRLRDAIPMFAARALRRPQKADVSTGEFWALRDVSFEVRSGEALAIIGANGAGKSTILKLLTRILRPTHGHCTVRGRVGALIEVCAGFHPDLTGRENVFLQGAIMGMPKREILSKFDEIVEFAGISKFMDTPVKRYSSGMEARLGFAIAAHLDPEILIVDEVLSIGDAAFQEKAFDRIAELVKREIPVVMVSHQLDHLARLCSHALFLEHGVVARTGTPAECIAAYLDSVATAPPGDDQPMALVIEAVRLARQGAVVSGGDVGVEVACAVRDRDRADRETIGVRVRSCLTREVLFETTLAAGTELPLGGRFSLALDLQLNVPPGLYFVETFVWDPVSERQLPAGACVQIDVAGGPQFKGAIQMNPRTRVVADGAAVLAHNSP